LEPKEICEKSLALIKRASAWNFARLMCNYYGNLSITLVGGAAGGDDLMFSASPEWVESHRLFPLESQELKEETGKLLEHPQKCYCRLCHEACDWAEKIGPYLRLTGKKILGGTEILSLRNFFPGGVNVVTSEGDAPALFREFKPFLELLNDPCLWPAQANASV
jgi:hypothetical protein